MLLYISVYETIRHTFVRTLAKKDRLYKIQYLKLCNLSLIFLLPQSTTHFWINDYLNFSVCTNISGCNLELIVFKTFCGMKKVFIECMNGSKFFKNF